MFPLLAGRVAVVTGAGRGIGRALAEGLADWGADVVVTDRKLEQAEETAQAIRARGRRACPLTWDVTDREAGGAVAAAAELALGPATILINNAGKIFRGDSDSAAALDAWESVIAVNLTGTYLATLAFLPQLERTAGAVINIGSLQSFLGLATKGAAYAASKGGVLLLTKEMAVEFAPRGVRVNGIAPGPFRTHMNPWIDVDAAKTHALVGRIPMGRAGDPGELVGTAVYLAAPELSGYVTGVMVPVDGGFLAM
ncbi:MAG: SDR family oxidoreductase [Pararhodobacter sp.]|nr:SDR family oxidoreductase [Pararhodobacter sp.]